MSMSTEEDIPTDEVADRVLGRLMAALPADEEQSGDRAMIARVADRVLARRAAHARLPAASRTVLRPRSWVPLAAAATLLVAAAAMAFFGRHHEQVSTPAPAVPSLEEPTPSPSPIGVAHEQASPPPDESVPTLDVSSLPTAPSAPARVAARVVETRSAAEIFALANDARRKRDVAMARSLYSELQTLHPRSPEASTSYVTLGRLELDHGRANAALAQYDRYLASGALELREDALAGRASALEGLGRREEERRAWEALLAAYPSSLFAPHAKQRLSTQP